MRIVDTQFRQTNLSLNNLSSCQFQSKNICKESNDGILTACATMRIFRCSSIPVKIKDYILSFKLTLSSSYSTIAQIAFDLLNSNIVLEYSNT